MAKKESQDGKSKKGLPRLMELAIYFIIQEIVGAYPDFSTRLTSEKHFTNPGQK